MNVSTYLCGSCAVAGISDLGKSKDPVDAMTTFCKEQLGVMNQFKSTYSKLSSYYVFCAGPEVKSTEVGGSHHSKDHWPRYGTEFAQFILSNNLGEIATLPARRNLKHHAKTTAQVWIWAPNQKKLEEWWAGQQPSAPIIAMPTTPIVDECYEEDHEDDYEEDDYPDDDPDYGDEDY